MSDCPLDLLPLPKHPRRCPCGWPKLPCRSMYPEWREWIETMVEARTLANKARLKIKWIEMKASEQQSFEATKRAEMKL